MMPPSVHSGPTVVNGAPHRRRIADRSRGSSQSSIRAVTRQIEAVGGVNLGQGTCELEPDPRVLEAASQAIHSGHNSYTLFDGIAELKSALIERYRAYNRMSLGPQHIVVTCGATGGLECVCKCFLDPGDEVVMFEPIYQYHCRLVRERGAVIKTVPLRPPEWTFRREELERAFSDKTKLFVFANPNNPTGKMFTERELADIGEICRKHNAVAVSDEVYEYISYDAHRHISIASLPEMFDHTITLSSASKTLFVTGWRVGWMIGPEDLMEPLGIKSDETYICAPAPFQRAVAEAFGLPESFFANIRAPFASKRQQLMSSLKSAGFDPSAPEGAYYILAGFGDLPVDSDEEAMTYLVKTAGVGAVPGSSFYPSGEDTGLLRFCFAVSSEKLDRACERLERL
jgi:aminotransferase